MQKTCRGCGQSFSSGWGWWRGLCRNCRLLALMRRRQDVHDDDISDFLSLDHKLLGPFHKSSKGG